MRAARRYLVHPDAALQMGAYVSKWSRDVALPLPIFGRRNLPLRAADGAVDANSGIALVPKRLVCRPLLSTRARMVACEARLFPVSGVLLPEPLCVNFVGSRSGGTALPSLIIVVIGSR